MAHRHEDQPAAATRRFPDSLDGRGAFDLVTDAQRRLEFERAAAIRDKIQRNKNRIGQPVEPLDGQQPQGDQSKPSGNFKNRRQRGSGRGSRNFRKDRDGDKDGD
jgi:hypothetical protein